MVMVRGTSTRGLVAVYSEAMGARARAWRRPPRNKPQVAPHTHPRPGLVARGDNGPRGEAEGGEGRARMEACFEACAECNGSDLAGCCSCCFICCTNTPTYRPAPHNFNKATPTQAAVETEGGVPPALDMLRL